MSGQLSYLLRHGAVKDGLTIDKEGYVSVPDLLAHLSKNGSSIKNLHQLQDITTKDNKKRFTLMEKGGVWYMKANQGHSIEVVTEEALTEITDPDRYPTAVHGTFRKCLPTILAAGLSRMSRNHIHFARGVGASAGIRSGTNVLIYANIHKAIADGIKFYISDNGVILTPGNDQGFLESKYFKSVADLKGNDLLKPIIPVKPQRIQAKTVIPKNNSYVSKQKKQQVTGPRCAGCLVFRTINKELQICLIATQSKIYGFPKGKMEDGESYLDCAFRELREETGIRSDQVEPLVETKFIDEAVRSSADNTGKPSIRLFITRLTAQDVKLQPEDIDEIAVCKFFSIDEALTLLMPKRQIVLKHAIEQCSIVAEI
ncbi:TRNA 2-phosphotransferase [uncultured virus]|nr:TRNA 2-phosphotransferase [uncultured virus]